MPQTCAIPFSSPAALFEHAKNQRFGPSPENSLPALRDRGTYIVGGRPVRLELLCGRAGKPLAVLVRTDWHTLTRFQRWTASILALFRADLGARVTASKKQSKWVAQAINWVNVNSSRYADTQRVLLANIKDGMKAGMRADAQKKELTSSIASQLQLFGLHNVVNKLKPLYASAQSPEKRATADELAKSLLSELRAQLDGKLDACKVKGVELDRSAVVDELLLQTEWGISLARAAESNPSGVEATVLKMIETHLWKPGTRTVQTLTYHIKNMPTADALPPKPCGEVALGDMHGNCLLLLHSLVKLGIVRIDNEQHWSDLRTQIDSLTTETPNLNYSGFIQMLDNCLHPVSGEPKSIPPKLILLGDLLADRGHNDMFMLAILDFMRRQNIKYDILFSNHDAQFIRYYLDNAKENDYANRYGVARNVREKEMLKSRNFNDYVDIAARQSVSLTRLHALIVASSNDSNPTARADFERMVQQSYLPRLKLVSTSEDGGTFYSHAFVHDRLFARLCKDAGADPASSFETQIEVINRWFHKEVLKSAESFEKLALARSGAAVAEVAWNRGWTGDHGDPRSRGAALPHRRVVKAVHGHTGPLAEALETLLESGKSGPVVQFEETQRSRHASPNAARSSSAVPTPIPVDSGHKAAAGLEANPGQRPGFSVHQQKEAARMPAAELPEASNNQLHTENDDAPRRRLERELFAVGQALVEDVASDLEQMNGTLLTESDLPTYLVQRLRSGWISLDGEGGKLSEKPQLSFQRQVVFC